MSMSRLLDSLNSKKMCLIASLPENKYEFAKAAWEAGCDAIKVHMNFWHRASGNTFGTLEENREVFERILKDSPVPVGIVIGENAMTTECLVDQVKEMGFDFISLYGHHTPASLAVRKDMANFYSVNYTYTFEEIKFISNSPFADIMELSICHPESYGERLNGRDLARYQYIANNSKAPCVVPTQHVVYPSDVKGLYMTGVKGIMVGAISYGKTLESISSTLKAFKAEIDKL